MNVKKTIFIAPLYVIFFISQLLMTTASSDDGAVIKNDPHRNKMGFFDIHICNWPERQYFFKMLFSTEKFNSVSEMEVFDPSGASLAVLNKSRFKKLVRRKKPEKRVFIVDMDIPEDATGGWYTIKVKTNNGTEYTARDYVPLSRIDRVTDMKPSSEDSTYPLPVTLAWNKVQGAGFYKVFIRDAWTEELILKTDLISDNNLQIANGKLLPGGYYSWKVHARDINGNALLGDFHMGSMSKKAFFNVAE